MCHFNSNNTSSKGVSQLLGWWLDANMKFKRFNFYARALFFALLALLVGFNFGHQVNELGQTRDDLMKVVFSRATTWRPVEEAFWRARTAVELQVELATLTQIHFALWHKYSFSIWDKYSFQFETNSIWNLRQILDNSHCSITAHTPP